MAIQLTNRQARQFMLMKHGLIGEPLFTGKEGVLAFVKQVGCIQFDPIDVCGKNAELVLQSRVKGFKKEMLTELLYEDRKLLDYFDKNLAIISVEDWKYFEPIRKRWQEHTRGMSEVAEVEEAIKNMIRQRGPLSSKDIDMNQKVDWYWSNTRLSRAALETLYFRGDLIVHHKSGTNKYYGLTEDYLPREILQEQDPLTTPLQHMKWRVLRRIGAVGMLWNKASDAWLFIDQFKSQERLKVFQELLEEDLILELEVEGVKDKLYCLSEDMGLLERVQGNPDLKGRMELIAALDNMMWDRKLIKALFGFDYKWEIYTPEVERQYGYYVLPIIYGEGFAGRCEVVCDRKNRTLVVKNIWLEKGVRWTKKLEKDLDGLFERFRKFHDLENVSKKTSP